VQPVHTAPQTKGSTFVVLVAEGVGQALDRGGAPDQEAVAVQPGVDLDERQGTVTGEHLERGAPKDDARDGDGPSRRRRERGGLDGRRAPAPLPGDRRPQAVAELDQLLDRGDPLVGQGGGDLVDLPHPAEQLVATLVGAASGQGRHPAGDPVEEQVTADETGRTTEVRWAAVHQLATVDVLVPAGIASVIVVVHRIASSSPGQVAVIDREPVPGAPWTHHAEGV
jgi:hypothetical protein